MTEQFCCLAYAYLMHSFINGTGNVLNQIVIIPTSIFCMLFLRMNGSGFSPVDINVSTNWTMVQVRQSILGGD